LSNIGDYQALVAALSVSFTDQQSNAQAITAKDATSLDNIALTTPVRLLLPYGGGESMAAELLEPDESLGPNVVIRWTFSDYLLWRPVAFGMGLGDSAYDLREYASAYMTAALTLNPSSITDRMTMSNIRLQIRDAIEFPEGSGDFFIGAIATWTVDEDDPPK
jgi:hypothetical protein